MAQELGQDPDAHPGRCCARRGSAGTGGTTHAGTLFGNACVDDQIANYIANGTLPARQPGYGADTYCKPLPQPVPEGATAKTAAKAGSVSAATRERLRAAATVGS